MDKNTSIPQDYSQDDLVELLRQYYKRLFPCKLYHRWLAYGGVSKNYFGNREFSFTLKDDVYIRYLSFADVSEFEKELIKRIPYKIDIGAVYNYKPKDHKTLQAGTFKPMEKELVFDIDMTDYDEVRTCCSGASICRKCWMFMTAALKILDAALEEDFGFKYRLWVYSGRRGIHCWVADSAARKLTQAGRSAVVEYLSVIKGSDSQVKKVYFKGSNLHPSLARANKIVKEFFCKYYLTEQNILDKEEQEKIMLKLIPDETTRQKVEKAWKDGNFSTKEKWDILENNVNAKMTLKHVLEEIMFQYVYPRLDINVSKGLNHLLKSPFCVHPKTGRVCVPIDPKQADEFDPMSVPTLSQLFQELDAAKEAADGNEADMKQKKDYMKTSLKHGIKIFQKFITDIEEKNKENRRSVNEQKAQTGDW
ncbi:DNA primase small subunit-like isoform X1 [Hydractinia symbiolongicarpus]|uniref:DNA primase small subunit-like isoform X1 n=1 Tax=Hydractinia symbiolongicarpus TaxID=13093 RepID=UPI00254D2670|nr:DNA primase small subunit-like isoform X1 [Hydractinia symbiolongicarpus]